MNESSVEKVHANSIADDTMLRRRLVALDIVDGVRMALRLCRTAGGR